MEGEWLVVLVVLLRRLLLVLCTYMTAHILSLLHDIAYATRMHLEHHSTAAGTAQPTAEPAVSGSYPTLRAGFSCREVPQGSTNMQHAWAKLSADHFNVRSGPNYPKQGIKRPSGPAMGEVVAIDILRTEHKIFDLLSLNHIELPAPTPGWAEVYPELFVINQMLPSRFCNSFTTSRAKTDGETFNLIVYVRLKPHLAPGWTDDLDPKNAEELLKRFLLRADQDATIAHCFKEIGVIRNIDDLASRLPSSLLSLMKKFNGKPVLTRPEHYFHRDPQNRYFMCDLDGHCYQYFTRTAIAKGMAHVRSMQFGYGYVVEARKEQEMPEKMVCSCEIFCMQESQAPWFPPQSVQPEQIPRSDLHTVE